MQVFCDSLTLLPSPRHFLEVDNMHSGAINKFLEKITKCLAIFLENSLPRLDEGGWWQTTVIDVLSYQQQAIVQQHGKTSLSQLDLAALLRVLDKNWFRLSEQHPFLPEARHFAKEMQTIRNRWAHMGSEQMSPDDFYRDLDTMQRFAKSVGANDVLLQEIQDVKIKLNSPAPAVPALLVAPPLHVTSRLRIERSGIQSSRNGRSQVFAGQLRPHYGGQTGGRCVHGK